MITKVQTENSRQFQLVQVIDKDGKFVDESYKSKITKELVQLFYRQLVCMRTFDRRAVNLQRQGRLGTYPPFEGQEAAQVGSALALDKDDWMFPTYRDHAASITFGKSYGILSSWNGRVEGNLPPEGRNILPPSVPIATQLPLAAGAAMAAKFKGSSQVAIAYFGDGATSEGDFHEGLNFASVFKAPVVFFNQNNNYAISVPIWKQMNSKTIAQKSVAYDIPGVRLDGNDIFAVYFETQKAIERARAGEGPTLIEAVTWRYGAHTTADDPTKYRDQEESKKRRENDPIIRLERFMKNYSFWDDEWSRQIQEEAAAEIEAAVKELETMPPPNVNDIYDYIFENPTWTIQQQKERYLKHLRGEA
ncbi:pyruvate dehydrogenase (acetyl-transferring) E1 component subunit alpha [Sporosarcina sp. ACRSM]|uniref:pyruvate dehydrogenase (acetyl-transferring) E1 component subunit alpha n=1 Tax=Sporosarcina sp. ACRSM TaxID=2918216 RepID=UPI001EF73BE1|nr:pyruvate dehydrogenase (acetyl-transferring) E1 component subunit alpha [Sporosarcina sp. ACRSM]MCG7335764.1 pyruvate dehydrogenase (acetyl-transferring) E1 component subunit alpha [Sporosarcina sp. ACRSM]